MVNLENSPYLSSVIRQTAGMQTKGNHNYYVYIITNTVKTVLYIGMTNDLQRRLNEHYEESGKSETFREGIIAIIYFIMNGLEMLLLPLPERNN